MKIAILTYLMDFNPGYSLTGIVYDQTKMLVRHGHTVSLFVSSQFNPQGLDFTHVAVETKMPFAHLTDYQSEKDLNDDHRSIIKDTETMLLGELRDFDCVFTHDFVLTGWFLPYGLGTIKASEVFSEIPFMHWIHSIPSGFRDWWTVRTWGKNHKLIFPNETDRLRVAEQYRGTIEDVRVIPHIKDPRSFLGFHEDTCKFIDAFPSVLQAPIVAVLPAGTDRLDTKGTDKVLHIMARLKEAGAGISLIMANQWATGRQRKVAIEPYINIGEQNGLTYGVDFVFTSDVAEEWANGLPSHMVRELFQLSNLFIFPTHCESFGLVVPEAALAGNVLPVLNASLAQQREISGNLALYFDFGSHVRNFKPADWSRYYTDLANIILGRLRENESINLKTFVRLNYNMDNLYRKYYLPTIMELRNELKIVT